MNRLIDKSIKPKQTKQIIIGIKEHQTLKIYAAENKITIRALIEQLIREYLI